MTAQTSISDKENLIKETGYSFTFNRNQTDSLLIDSYDLIKILTSIVRITAGKKDDFENSEHKRK